MGMADTRSVPGVISEPQPGQPVPADRDRFVPSNGHGRRFIKAQAAPHRHDLPMSELQNFRQRTKTPVTEVHRWR